MSDPAIQLAALVVAAVAAGWLADRLRIPAILPLLAVGLLAGPGFRLIDPDALFGDLLTSAVGLAVGVILFEGGLSLRLSELDGSQRAIWGLVTVGVATTWLLGSVAAVLLFDMSVGVAVVLGAILVVSGPTVVGPILQTVKPSRKVGSILKWESIFIDPIGAMLAVLAFDVVIAGADGPGLGALTGEVALFIVAGAATGTAVATVSVFVLRRHWVGEHLISLFGLAMALIAFMVADVFAHESGLLATTVLGLILSNHHRVRTEPLVRFSEVLRVLLIGILFIVLSARLTREQLSTLGAGAVVFIVVLVVVARPLATWISTFGSGLEWREKGLLAGVAPRGIVAASIASVFGVELESAGIRGAELLTPLVFAVIVATVLIYGFGAGPLARLLGLARRGQEGVLVLGAGVVELAIAEALADADVDVILATVNRNDERRARMLGLRTFYGNVLNDDIDLRLEMSGIGRFMALTPNDEVNTLGARRFEEVFGGGEIYQLPPTSPPPGVETMSSELGGRGLFHPDFEYAHLRRILEDDGVHKTALSEKFDKPTFLERHGPDLVPLMAVRDGRLLVNVIDAPTPLIDRLQSGDVVLWVSDTDGASQQLEVDRLESS